MPVWFHKIHIVNAPWIFEWLYSLARPFLSDHARGNVVLHKKKDSWDALYKEVRLLHYIRRQVPDLGPVFFRLQVDRKILPLELGGEAGAIDNSACLEEVMSLDDYFQQLATSETNNTT